MKKVPTKAADPDDKCSEDSPSKKEAQQLLKDASNSIERKGVKFIRRLFKQCVHNR